MASTVLGCAPSLPDVGVEEQWTDAMERLSLFAVYPMNEDVRLGDVFLHVNPRSGPAAWVSRQFGDDGATPRFAAVAMARPACDLLMAALTEQGRTRPRMAVLPPDPQPEEAGAARARRAAAPSDTAANPAFGTEGEECLLPGPAPRRAGRGDFDIGEAEDLARRPAIRLQSAAIPKLTVARLTEGQLGGSGVFGNIGAQLGLGSAGRVALNIELKKLQMLTLDMPRAFRLLEAAMAREFRAWRPAGGAERRSRDPGAGPETLFTPLDVLRALAQTGEPELVEAACRAEFDRINDRGVSIVIANRVLYAGGIDYGFREGSETAGRVSIDLQNTLPAPVRRAPGVPALPEKAAEVTVKGEDLTAQEASRLAGLAGNIIGGPANSLAGVQGRFGIGSAGEIVLSGSFRRPMAVGFGAALRFRIEQALLPHSRAEVQRAIAYCRQAVAELRPPAGADGMPSSNAKRVPLESLLRANYLYVGNLAGENVEALARDWPGEPSAAVQPGEGRRLLDSALRSQGSIRQLPPLMLGRARTF